MRFAIGADLGGTRIRALVRDEGGDIVGRAATLTLAHEGQSAVVARIVETIQCSMTGLHWEGVTGIGIGVPGPVDPHEGLVLQAPNLAGWRRVALGPELHRALGVPVRVGNDANLAALGEHIYGAGQGIGSLVYLTISTGIGGGIIADGRLINGVHGAAGEIGHTTLLPDGPLCACGNRGCLEALGSGTAIARMGRESVEAGRGDRLLALAGGEVGQIDARIVGQAAKEGDAEALAIVQRAATYIGIGLANVCNTVDPDMLILGGGVTKIGDLLFATIRQTIAVRAMPPARGVRVVPAALGDDVVLYGAVALFHSSQGAVA